MRGEFTAEAEAVWDSIPQQVKEKLLQNVWCGACISVTTIADFKGQMEGRDLILVGRCVKCGGEVARVIEGE